MASAAALGHRHGRELGAEHLGPDPAQRADAVQRPHGPDEVQFAVAGQQPAVRLGAEVGLGHGRRVVELDAKMRSPGTAASTSKSGSPR